MRALSYYLDNGKVEPITGDTLATARDWLERAARELPGVAQLIEIRQWRLAYNAAYDVCRHSAEAVVTLQGLRVTNSPGAHETTLGVAHAVLAGRDDVFSTPVAGKVRQKRHALEYLDIGRPADVDESEAEWAAEVANRAVRAAQALIDDTDSGRR